jgi:hypothetical protein
VATSSRKKPPVRAIRQGTVAGLIRSLAQTLRGGDERAKALRSVLERALTSPAIETAFDVFGSELPDEVFAGVFDPPRPKGWREVDL